MNGDREAQFWEDMRTAKEDDTISRQMALDKIAEYFGDLRIVVHHDMLRIIKELPPAQVMCRDCQWYSEEYRMCTEHGIEDRDGSGYCSDGVQRKNILDIQDEQPDIIVCADCKHWICHDRRCGFWNHGVKPLDWCCHAERRTNA